MWENEHFKINCGLLSCLSLWKTKNEIGKNHGT